MKKIFNLSVLLFIICTFYWACKKDQTVVANKNTSTEEQQLIANAKTYFENNVQNKSNNGKELNDITNIDSGQFNPIQLLTKKAVWDKACTMQLSIGKIVVVPIQFNDSLYVRPNSTDVNTRLSISKLSKLIVYTDSANQIHTEVVSASPDSDFIKNPKRPFSGVAFVQDWQGNFLRAYHYRNGKIKSLRLNTGATNKTIATNSLMAPQPTDPGCTENDYYRCDVTEEGYQNCTYLGSTETGCDDDIISVGSGAGSGGGGGSSGSGSSGTGGSGGTPSGGDYGNVAGGGGSGSGNANSVGIFNVTRDIVTDSCLRNVVEHVMTSGAKNIITNTLNNIFAVSTKLNLTFQDSANLAPGADGNANARTRAIFSNGGINVTITLNQNYLVGASNEYIASTIVHEIIHAYLAVYPTLLGNINEHLEMGENYVNQMSAAIIDFYPNLSKTVAYSLVLDGLATFYINGSFTPPGYWDQLVANYGFNNLPNNVNNWDYEASSYKKDGDGGTRCSN